MPATVATGPADQDGARQALVYSSQRDGHVGVAEHRRTRIRPCLTPLHALAAVVTQLVMYSPKVLGLARSPTHKSNIKCEQGSLTWCYPASAGVVWVGTNGFLPATP